MDTGNDPRFQLLDRALADVKHNVENGRLRAQYPRQKAAEAVQRGASALKALMYSYAEPDQVRSMPQFNELQESMAALETLLGGPGFEGRIDDDAVAVAHTVWTLQTVRSLADRLDLLSTEPETAVDVVAGRIVSVNPHPDADNLVITRVAAGRSLRVVTNDQGVKADDRVGVAMLPPVALRGVVSQGMFLGAGGDGILKDVNEGRNGRPELPAQAYAETRGRIQEYIAGK